jgi:hypothetical protein
MVMPHTTDDNHSNQDRPNVEEQFRKFQRSRKRIRHAAVTIAGVLVFAFAATAPDVEAPPAQVFSAGRGDPVEDVDHSMRALDTFWRFAVNALVLPLIDDTDPPRWSDHMIDWICDGRGQVTVDGKPLRDGAPVTAAGVFYVRWDLQRCAPFAGADLLLDGVVELAVSRDGTGFSARVVSPVSGSTPAGRFHLPHVVAEGAVRTSP